MEILPYYVALGVGAGFVVVLFVQNLRLAFHFLITFGKAAVVLLLIMMVGSFLGLWQLPRTLAVVPLGLRRLWQPLQSDLLSWVGGLFY